ncbi:MAG: DUF599 domain-containing protein [Alphaproteobacteria bacterium]|nr:DUF599 domain-containing protein [Alphaproteobacteria bacterium]
MAAAFGLLAAYHLFLVREVRLRPDRTAIGHANRSRQIWVRNVMEERRDILAVQALRNWNMAASFLASTSILLAIGILSFLIHSDDVPDILYRLNFFGSRIEVYFTFKVLILALCFFAAFFSFSLALRYFNHVSIDITLPVTEDTRETLGIAAALFDRGAHHYTVGMRAYYLAIPVTFWFFGPIWLFIAALALIAILYRLDHVPATPGKV